MKLDASKVAATYFPKQYVPNNQLSVAKSDGPSPKEDMDYLNVLIPTLKVNQANGETQPLIPFPVAFEHQEHMTRGSVDVVGRKELEDEFGLTEPPMYKVGPQEWDYIYRVRPTSM